MAVHDLVIHPRERDLVIATHGRGIYVLNMASLEGLTPGIRSLSAYLFDVKPALRFEYLLGRGLNGGRLYAAPNPEFGATFAYYLRESVGESIQLFIQDQAGNLVADLTGSGAAGLHQIVWNLQGLKDKGMAPLGEYRVRLDLGGRTLVKRFQVVAE